MGKVRDAVQKTPAKPARPPKLSDLYYQAQADFYGPIMEEMARTEAVGDDGLTEEQVGRMSPFMDVDEFKARLDKAGTPYRL